MKLTIPTAVQSILGTLLQHGHEAYVVGGCVRDALLGREPEDWDITTSARPEEVKEIFPVTIDTGIKHGTVTVREEGENYEVTTFRIDGKYADHRRPEEVTFTRTLEEDLLRRDFTINAMAYNDADGLVDLYGGQQDLAGGIIRCVGEPEARFSEDALRILRAFRFESKLGAGCADAPRVSDAPGVSDAPRTFTIEPATRRAIHAQREGLRFISAERIQMEMTKILTSPYPEVLREMYELGVTEIVLPEFDAIMQTGQHTPHHNATVGEHTIRAMQLIDPEPVLRWTMLIHDMGKPACRTSGEDGEDHFYGHAEKSADIARDIMNRMKMDNETKSAVIRLVRTHDYRMPAALRAVRRAVHRIGPDIFDKYCKVRRADVLAQSDYLRAEKIDNLDAIDALYRQILDEQQCVTLDSLAVGGRDLIEAGVPRGPEIGEILNRMLEWVIDDPALNDKETLLARWRSGE